MGVRRPTGFTLLELVVVVAIVLVVAAGAMLAWPRVEAAFALETGLHQLASELQVARALAVASAGRVRVVLRVGERRYRRERALEGGYEVDRVGALPSGIAVAAVGSGGDLAFSGRGDGENATVVLADRRGVRRSLVLNQRGRMTIGGAAP
jgi:prepilin-type N-terminal cleavage/methylation domain-containing protein